MFYLIYISTPDPSFGEAQVRELLERSRNFNRKKEITGCLLFYQGVFLQYLEGSQIEVLMLFDRIKEDDRHSHVKVISHGHMPSRVFGPLGMAYEDFRRAGHRMEYLELLVGSFIESPDSPIDPSPRLQRFWFTAKKLLDSRNRSDLVPSEK